MMDDSTKEALTNFWKLVLSSVEARGVRNQVSGIEHVAKVRASARKNTFWRTFVRFSVLLTITRDPCKLEGRNSDRRWDIFGLILQKNRINFDCIGTSR